MSVTKNQGKIDVLAVMRSRMPNYEKGIPKNLTVSQWADYWLQYLTPDIKESTRCSYSSTIDNHIKRVFSNIKLTALTSEDVQLFIISLTEGVALEEPLSAKTIRNIHGVLHKCLQAAFEMKLIGENPAKHTTLPKAVKPDLLPLNNNQLSDFLNVIQGHRLENLFKLAIFTGLRKGELIGLTWDCFDFDEGCIHLYRQMSYDKKKRKYYFDTLKNGKPRTIYPAAAVMEMMQHYQNSGTGSTFVFTGTEDCSHLTYSMIRKPFDRIVEKLGIPEFRFHDLRHTYAVISLKAGVDLKTLSESMGHNSVAFTLDTYAFALVDMKTESAKRMQTFIDSQKLIV